MLDFYFQGKFKKDFNLLERRRYNTDAILDIIGRIIWEEPLPEHCREHTLSGNYTGFTECHALNDCLLIYMRDTKNVIFSRTGTHSDLF